MRRHLDANGVSGFGPELQLVSHNHGLLLHLQNALKLFMQPPALPTLDHGIGILKRFQDVCVCVGAAGGASGGIKWLKR